MTLAEKTDPVQAIGGMLITGVGASWIMIILRQISVSTSHGSVMTAQICPEAPLFHKTETSSLVSFKMVPLATCQSMEYPEGSEGSS